MAKGRNHSYMKYVSVVKPKKKKEDEEGVETSGGDIKDLLRSEREKRHTLEQEIDDRDTRIRELNDRLENIEGRDLEEELRSKVEELNQIKNAYAKKMKNTIALQRIKYEREIDKIRKDFKRLSLAKAGGAVTDEDVKSKELELEKKEAELEEREQKVNELRAKLESNEGGTLAIASGESSLGEIESALREKEGLIAQMEEKLSNRDEELEELKGCVDTERKKREAIAQELLNVKKGSVAMMKYNMAVQHKKAEEELAEMRKALEGEVQKRQQMEDELSAREEELAKRESDLTTQMEQATQGKVDMQAVRSLQSEIEKRNAEVKKREEALKAKEREILQRIKGLEEEIKKKIKDGKILQDIKREFAQKEEDLKRIKNILKEKEEDLRRKEKEIERRSRENQAAADSSSKQQIESLQKELQAAKVELNEAMKNAQIGSPVGSGDGGPEVDELREQLNARTMELKKREGQVAKLTQKLTDLASGKRGEAGDLTHFQIELESKDQEIAILKEDLLAAQRAAAGKGTIKLQKGQESATLTALNEQIKELRAQLEMRNVEYEKLSKDLGYKEEEFDRREMEIEHKEKVLKAEMRKIKEAKDVGGTVQEVQLKKRLEALEQDISRKEEEVKKREVYISSKLQELQKMQQGMVDQDLDSRAEERQMEFDIQKSKTGNVRLDDLLFGGIPFGSNILIMGPAFIGKETLVNNFLVEGITKGITAVMVTTDCSPDDIREELKYILPEIAEYEKKNLVKYIDVYSMAMGLETEDPNTMYVEDPTDYKGINKALVSLTKELGSQGDHFRFSVRSISTLITYSEQQETFRFLQGMTGRIKRQRVVGLYLLDKGMHTDPEIQTLSHVMDGSIEFKTDSVKTFLAVQGVGDTQSRQWIQYQYSKRGLTIGSFSLDKIK